MLYRWMERKIARQVDAIVAISPDIHEDIRRIDDHDQKVHRIPNGVDLNRFHSQEETYDEFTVHFQGRLVEMKNPDVLIEAAARSEGDWRVTFGGEGPLRDDLEALVTKYGLERRIDFLGFVPEDDLPDRYARSHVYALPSTYEGMPLTVLEAAASGTAILASRRAATDFVDETCGWVVKPDPNRIAATLDRAANEIETVVAKGERARERANNFSWGAIAARYENLFDWLVQA